MDRMLVVVFNNESKAYEGKKALLQLAGEGSIGVYGYAVLAEGSELQDPLKFNQAVVRVLAKTV